MPAKKVRTPHIDVQKYYINSNCKCDKHTFIRFSASSILALAASSFFFRLAYE